MISHFAGWLATLLFAALAAPAHAMTFYLAPDGDNARAGTSVATAWRDFAPLNARDLQPGDRVLLRGGATFAGTLQLDADDAGDAGNPVVIGSFGEGRAVISAGTGSAIRVYNAGGVRVENLRLRGGDGNQSSGLEFYCDLNGAVKLRGVEVSQIEVSGFGGSGIRLGAWPADKSASGFAGVSVAGCSLHDNADGGLSSWGAALYAHRDVTVRDCDAFDNRGIAGKGSHSGNGIVLGDVEGALIERCRAWNNGERSDFAGGGPVGIWAYNATRVTIQFCESWRNRSATKDGGGFDLDGGVTDSLMQFNYSHDNDGAGFLLYQYPGAPKFGGNVVRNNISRDDGRTNLGGIFAGDGANNCQISGNTIFYSRAPANPDGAAIWTRAVENVRFTDNLVVLDKGALGVKVEGGRRGVEFAGNAYWGGAPLVKWGGQSYADVASWRAATGQEKIGN